MTSTCGRKVVQACPVPPVASKHRRPVDGVEIHVVFPHELVKADVVGVQPPFFPFGRIAGSDAWVSYAGVELVLALPPTHLWKINGCSPRHLKGIER